MRGWVIRNEYGDTTQTFFGNAEQLLEEHGPKAKFLHDELTHEKYTGDQPSDVLKAQRAEESDEPAKAAAGTTENVTKAAAKDNG